MDRQQILEMLRGATLEPYQLGLSFRSQMIQPVPERCVSVPAGPVCLVVEARYLNDRAVSQTLGDEPAEGDDPLFDDYGPTVHVYGSADGIEHLRFDCFAHKPHYHYVHESGESIPSVASTSSPRATWSSGQSAGYASACPRCWSTAASPIWPTRPAASAPRSSAPSRRWRPCSERPATWSRPSASAV